MNLDPPTLSKLALQIASIAERAYRRGVQHGVESGITPHEAFRFRYYRIRSDRLLKTSPNVPFDREPWQKARWTTLDRLTMEIPPADCYKELRMLLREAGVLE